MFMVQKMNIRYKIELTGTIFSCAVTFFIFAIKNTPYNPFLAQVLKKWCLKSNSIQVCSIFETGNIIHNDNRIVEI